MVVMFFNLLSTLRSCVATDRSTGSKNEKNDPFWETRFRGQEDCQGATCPFRSQKTTHFHCNRSGCDFTFKNKADMEKHKNFHMKDEQLCKDGFRKYMKHDDCGFDGCRLVEQSVNHDHLI